MRVLLVLLASLPFCSGAGSLAVDDPGRLGALEREGFGLAPLALRSEAGSNHELAASPRYRSIVAAIEADLAAAQTLDAALGPSMKFSHRLFDRRWLRSPAARFELSGIVNRMDRAPFNPGSCGEIRFLYRLAYRRGEAYSRLPMTVNAVFLLPGGGCRIHAQRWQDGLRREHFPDAALHSVEVNLQSVRWPSTIRPDMAGHAEYVLRVFRPRGDTLVESTLENTPDVSRLRRDPAARARLLGWLRAPENLAAIDQGIARIPEEFLATRATSVALHGVHRLANMPFSQLFGEKDFDGIPFGETRHVRSAHGLLRRMDDSSCSGCHQGRTVAGFHFLGTDPQGTATVNAIEAGASPHFLLDQPRRLRFHDAVLRGAAPELRRPLSVRADEETGGFGAHCGLGDAAFADWTCAAGLECRALVADDRVSRTGICLPAEPQAGSPCEPARLRPHRDPHRDRLVDRRTLSCGAGAVCEQGAVGFPGGMCARPQCADLREGETCGSIAVLAPFNACLARREPFAECLAENVRPAGLQACDARSPCRDDYICARSAEGHGACIPPYFLFQLRLDGHPAP